MIRSCLSIVGVFGCILVMQLDAANAQDDATKRTRIEPTGEIETVHTGFAFTEGPAWDPSGVLYFTDIPNTTIHKLDDADEVSVFTNASNFANGILIAADGRMLVCQMGGQVVSYDKSTGEATVLADKFGGKRFNAPNDLVIDTDGGIYFTDPLFRAPNRCRRKSKLSITSQKTETFRASPTKSRHQTGLHCHPTESTCTSSQASKQRCWCTTSTAPGRYRRCVRFAN